MASLASLYAAIAREDPDTARSLVNAGKGLSILERLAAAAPSNLESSRDLADGHSMLGTILARGNQLAQALEQFRKSVVIREALAAGQPLNVRDQRQLMIAYSKVGELLGPAPPSLQDAAGAVASFNKMLAIADKLAAADRHDKRAAFDHAWPW